MSTASPRPTLPRRRTATIVAAAAVAVVGMHRAADTLPSAALLTDTQTTSAARVTSDQLAIDVAGGTGTRWLNALSLVPGASAYAAIDVTNSSTATRLRYAVTGTSSSSMASAFTIDVVSLASTSTTCNAGGFSGGTAAGSASRLGSSGGAAIVGDPTTGAQTGDRLLAAGASERLCAKVTFPFGQGLGADARGATATVSFTFAAEQA